MFCLLALFSVVIGSFLNVVIHRLPIMIQEAHLGISPSVNLFLPRSFCIHCKMLIHWWQNIPLLSYLALGGRCANCHSPIALRYPLVEAFSAVLALYSSWHFGFTSTLIFALLFIWLLIPLFLIDLNHQILPDSLSLSLLWLGLLANTHNLFTALPNAVISAVVAYLFLWILIQIFYLLTGKIGMGNGDFKLFSAFGAWFGMEQLPIILLCASFSGSIVGLLYLRHYKKSRDTPIPFGPFLCVAGLVSLFWGKTIVNWLPYLF